MRTHSPDAPAVDPPAAVPAASRPPTPPRSTAPGAALRRAAELALRVANAPFAAISPADGGAPTVAVADGAADAWRARGERGLLHTLCRYTAAFGRPLLIEDAREHELVRESPEVWLGEAGYAGVPVRTADGAVVGTLCVADSRPRRWTEEEANGLSALASLAALALEPGGPLTAVPAVRGAAHPRRASRVSLRMLEKAIETMQLGVTITDLKGRILYVNQADARMHGYRVEELIGKHARVFAPPEHARPIDRESLEDVASWSRETVNVRQDGTLFPVLLRSDVVRDATGRALGIVTCCEDVTNRKRMERQLLQNAFYHPVTGLPNRALLGSRLELSIDRARRGSAVFSVLVIGLDRFKLVNDSLGREAGDQLLLAVARRLRERVRADTLVAHLAGDEFAILLDETDGLGDAARVAHRVSDAFSLPFQVESREVFMRASVGIALSLTGYQRPEDVLRDATIAMYRSKAAGEGQYEVFDADMHVQAMTRLRMETDLRRAVDRGELRVHYQPIVELASGRVAGFEALARWEHPELGLLQPAEFIPLAEETGLILPLGLWVLNEACRQLRLWQERSEESAGLTMAVNLSPRQFAQPDLVERIAAIVTESRIAHGTLKVEVTESVILHHSDDAVETLHRLKALGIQVYIDDFGTGYSSLSYLNRLPLDALKIDRSFIHGADGSANLPLVRMIVALAKALDVAVVTEGVETLETLEELRTLRCEYGQGFLFSRPLESGEIEHMVDRVNARAS